MDIIAIQQFLGERGIQIPESVAALAQRLQLTSYWELAGLASLIVFAGANLKALPLVHSLRLLPSLGRLLSPRLLGRPSSKGKGKKANDASSSEDGAAAHSALFRHNTIASRAIPLDLDINFHKSNSTFFADADVSRAALLTSMLSDALASRGALFVLAGTQCKFLREIRPLQRYVVASRVLAWTDKAFYVVTYFVSPHRGDAAAVCGLKGGPAAVLVDDKLRKVFAIMVSKYVFKAGRATVAPAEVFGAAGLLLVGDEVVAKSGGSMAKTDILTAGEVEKAIEEGVQFVRDCML